jgi:hypothetical protein
LEAFWPLICSRSQNDQRSAQTSRSNRGEQKRSTAISAFSVTENRKQEMPDFGDEAAALGLPLSCHGFVVSPSSRRTPFLKSPLHLSCWKRDRVDRGPLSAKDFSANLLKSHFSILSHISRRLTLELDGKCCAVRLFEKETKKCARSGISSCEADLLAGVRRPATQLLKTVPCQRISRDRTSRKH